MTARTIATSICRPLARPVAGAGDGGGAWTPDQLTNVLQRMDSFAYAASNIGGLPVVESSVGTAAVPRGQRCVLFDGVNDVAVAASRIGGATTTAFTVAFNVVAATANRIIASDGMDVSVLNGWEVQTGAADATRLQLFVGSAGSINAITPTGSLSSTAMRHAAFVYDGALVGNAERLKCFIDGVQVSLTFTGTIPASITLDANVFRLGAYVGGAFFSGQLQDFRYYSVAKSASEIQAIANQHLTPTTIDRTGLLGAWWLNEESGTTHYDWSGNGRNLTATNVTQSTYHATDSGVRYNAANELGYTLSGSVVIPRNEATPSQDAAGGSLQFSGPIKLNATMEVPCVTGDGSMYADLGAPLVPASANFTIEFQYFPIGTISSTGPFNQGNFTNLASRFGMLHLDESTLSLLVDHVSGVGPGAVTVAITKNAWNLVHVVRSGSSYTLTINGASSTITNSGTINQANTQLVRYMAPVSGRVADFRITTGGVTRFYPLQAGPGTSNTNRDLHWVASDGTGGVVSGAIVNGTVSSIWANRTNVVHDWCIEYGGSIAANGAFVPGRIGSGLDAAGNAKGIAAGTHGNPYSRFVPNFWSAPSLVNIGSTASDLYAPSGMAGVQAESTADTRYANQTRYLAVATALTGSDKTNAQGWVA